MAVQLNKSLINARLKSIYDGWNVRILSALCPEHHSNCHRAPFLEHESQ